MNASADPGRTGPVGPVGPFVPGGTDGRVRIEQNFTVGSGFAYGVIGADLHVFGDGTPLYVLENHRRVAEADPDWLAELPSRMLNARFAVVGFTGRADELRQLARWRDDGPRLAVRWLHAPGGQGKTRLADRFAGQSAEAGWKAVTATHGPGSVLVPGESQDLRTDGCTGVLLIVDYADRWPLTHLTALLSNALLHRPDCPARVLLLARTSDPWPALRAELARHQPHTSSQLLEPLPDGSGQRAEMFEAARTGFAARYGIDDPAAIAPPDPLEHPDYGLTLTLHMAALVAVDAHRTGRRAPHDMAGLTVYLLDREQAHWARLHGDGTHELDPAAHTYRTPPAVMNRTVFTAALTGALSRPDGTAVVESLGPGPDSSPEQIVADHAVCYPPSDPSGATVLEPLAPDRLAEDFLALTLPGHPADYPAQPWAPATAVRLLRSDGGTPPAWTPRAVSFLAAAAGRWPHVGPSTLFPVLLDEPELAVVAGSAALSDLAAVPDIGIDVLEAVAAHLPEQGTADLAVGSAAVTRSLTERQLKRTEDPAQRALRWYGLGARLLAAGLFQESAEANRKAAGLYRQLMEARPVEPDGVLSPPGAGRLRQVGATLSLFLRRGRVREGIRELHQYSQRAVFACQLALSLVNLSHALARLGLGEEALAASQEAIEVVRRSQDDPVFSAGATEALAGALNSLTTALWALGRYREALEPSRESVRLYRKLIPADPGRHGPRLATALTDHGVLLGRLARNKEALRTAEEAVDILRGLAAADPAAHAPVLAACLNNLGRRRAALGDFPQAARATEEAVGLLRGLVEANPLLFRPELARALGSLGVQRAEDTRGGLEAAEESVRLFRELARTEPVHQVDLGIALGTLGSRLKELGRHREARAALEEGAAALRAAMGTNPVVVGVELVLMLGMLAEARMAGVPDAAGALAALTEAEGLAERAAADNPAIGVSLLRETRQMKAWARHVAGLK
ncbi:tetratricopeptide repeat protein [Streptomyces sp. UNOB3_S3]|uniref:tetratricopeptide repeat protein n=1 Tax=Streptomyces sp. UNOB3_S3 TaxID=2871682 RepID=UPI001E568AF0|nr:tetratricopeptide repeat protein [Streptomyces sp. UNOB3_S3]MCC3775070.1 tetratricopeptide repeat protein [Streptomyces sp. UNOB3_S3]